MRQYAAVSPRFWNGPTGRAIRAAGRDAQVLALYLITGPSAHMMGLYYLPFPTLCHEAGFTPDEARETLAILHEHDFAHYDEVAELVWIPEGAAHQIGDALKPGDKRSAGIERVLEGYIGHPYGRAFLRRYKSAYSLSINIKGKPLTRASQAPPKPETGTGAVPGTETGAGGGTRPSGPPTLETTSGPRANPLVTGRRVELETECLRLVGEEARATGRDSAEVMAERSGWRDTRKVNPAAMTDDRLLNTVLDLRKAKATRDAANRPALRPIESRIITSEEAYERNRQQRAAARDAEGQAGPDQSGGGPRGLVGGRDQEKRSDQQSTASDQAAGPVEAGVPRANEALAPAGALDRRR